MQCRGGNVISRAPYGQTRHPYNVPPRSGVLSRRTLFQESAKPDPLFSERCEPGSLLRGYYLLPLPESRLSISYLSPLLLLGFVIGFSSRPVLAEPPDTPCTENTSSCPDSPGFVLSTLNGFSDSANGPGIGSTGSGTMDFGGQTTGSAGRRMLPAYVKRIPAGEQVPQQKARDKALLGLRESVNPYAMLGWSVSAGWSYLIDSSPKYGVNGPAYAQRLGAAAALASSKEIFGDAVLATAFHQDPRYYQRGRSHKFLNRVAYAATRPVVGRTDGGKTIPNFALILGAGGAAALTQTYYPERDTTGPQVARTWATSLGGSALGYLASEFGNEILQWAHLSKLE